MASYPNQAARSLCACMWPENLSPTGRTAMTSWRGEGMWEKAPLGSRGCHHCPIFMTITSPYPLLFNKSWDYFPKEGRWHCNRLFAQVSPKQRHFLSGNPPKPQSSRTRSFVPFPSWLQLASSEDWRGVYAVDTRGKETSLRITGSSGIHLACIVPTPGSSPAGGHLA